MKDKTEWVEELAYDTTAMPLRIPTPQTECKCKGMTSYSGADSVIVINGDLQGSIEGFAKSFDRFLNGTIDINHIRFNKEIIYPNESLMVVVYQNEFYDASYEVIQLSNMAKIASAISVNTICPEYSTQYEGKAIELLKEVPEDVKNMSDDDFEKLVSNAMNRYMDKYISKELPIPPNLANKVYYWVLNNMRFL